jgi:hypothetical protein
MRGTCGRPADITTINFYIVCLLIEIPIEIPSDTDNDRIMDTATAYAKVNLPRMTPKVYV